MQALDLILRLLNVNMDIFSLYYSYSGNEISYSNVTFDIYFSSFIKQKIDEYIYDLVFTSIIYLSIRCTTGFPVLKLCSHIFWRIVLSRKTLDILQTQQMREAFNKKIKKRFPKYIWLTATVQMTWITAQLSTQWYNFRWVLSSNWKYNEKIGLWKTMVML